MNSDVVANKLGRIVQFCRKGFWAFLFFFLTFSIYLLARMPQAYDNFWAEDGSVFYNNFLNNPEIDFLLEVSLGYYLLIDRLIAIPIFFVSPTLAPIINTIITVSFIAVLTSRFFLTLCRILRYRILALVFSCICFMLPIASFEGLGAATSLHFLLNFYVVFVLFKVCYGMKFDKFDLFLIIISILSGPLTMLLVPVACYLMLIMRKQIEYSASYIATIIVCILIQFLAIFSQYLSRSRSISSDRSGAKVLYLYFERVFGFNLIPGWSYVNSDTFNSQPLSYFETRLTVLVFVHMLLVIFFVFSWKRCFNENDRTSVFVLMLSMIFLWFIPGYFFSPEPRYAVAPSLCLFLSFIVLFDKFLSERVSRRATQVIILNSFLCIIISLVSLNSKPSDLRVDGPSLKSQIEARLFECSEQNLSVRVLVRPAISNLHVTIPCSRILAD